MRKLPVILLLLTLSLSSFGDIFGPGQGTSLFGPAATGGGGGSGITHLNTLTGTTQTFATGTAGADFNISSSGSTHTFNFPDASHSNRGLLSTSDWDLFNAKQSPGSYITALTDEVSASGPGSASATISNAAVIAKLLTGYTSGAGTITASDSILGAIQKLNGNAALLAPINNPVFTGILGVGASDSISLFNAGGTAAAGIRRAYNVEATLDPSGSSITAFRAHPTLAAGATSTTYSAFNGANILLGAGATVSYVNDFYSNTQTAGSLGNVAFSDSNTPVGNWFLYQNSSSRASHLNGILQVTDGTAGAPSIVPATGTTNGFYFDGVNNITYVAANGVEAARFSGLTTGAQLNMTGGSDLSGTGVIRVGFNSSTATPPNSGTGLRVVTNQNYNGTANATANALYVTSDRAITTSQTENLGGITGRFITQFEVPSGQTYTNPNLFETIRLDAISKSGTGTLAVLPSAAGHRPPAVRTVDVEDAQDPHPRRRAVTHPAVHGVLPAETRDRPVPCGV